MNCVKAEKSIFLIKRGQQELHLKEFTKLLLVTRNETGEVYNLSMLQITLLLREINCSQTSRIGKHRQRKHE